MTADPFNLARFIEAQEHCYADVLQELRNGRKRSHWIWFIFPQIDGLGFSSTAKYYSIRGIEEARAYLAHPVLGTRLRQCVETVNGLEGVNAYRIFGYPDHLKFCSSMTLFELAAGAGDIFSKAIDKYYASRRDEATFSLVHTDSS